ncbi:MAG: hypothetical protein Q9178_007292 [Gyalolechia marmorata]
MALEIYYGAMEYLVQAKPYLHECDDTEGIRSCLVSTLWEALPTACFLVTSRLIPEIEVQFENHPRLEIKATDEDVGLYVSEQIPRKPTLKRHINADPKLRELMIETIGRKSEGMHARGVPEDDCRAQILELISKEHTWAISEYLRKIDRPELISRQNICAYFKYLPSYDGRLGSLASAAAFGLTSIVNHLLNEGVDVNQINHSGITALMSAAGAGYVDTVKALLAADADVNKVDEWGTTALMEAAGGGYVDTVRALLAADADVNKADERGTTALMEAARKGHDETVQMLLDHKANLEAATRSGKTSLLWAAEGGSSSTVRLLLDKGANMNAGDGLFGAAITMTTMVELVVNRIGKLTKADNMKNPLTRLLKLGRPSFAIFELLIEKGADPTGPKYGEAPIQVAAGLGDVEAVRLLLKHGVSPNIRDENGYTPTHRAAFCRNHEMIEILVDHGADLTAQNDAGESFIHTFLYRGFDNNLVSLLVRLGVPVNTPDAEGRTALHIAAHKGFDSTVKFLMEHGADGSREDHGGHTPLETAAFSGNEKLVEQMLKHLAIPCTPHLSRLLAGARLRHAVKENDTVSIQEILKEPDLDVTIPEVFGRTALHFAAYYGQKNIVESLLARGALVNARRADPARTDPIQIRLSCEATHQNFGTTPLHIAAGQGHTDVVELLLKHGADLDATDDDGHKAFFRAVREGHAKVIKVLLEHGSKVSESPEKNGVTALFISVFFNQEDVVRLLLENGADAERDTRWGEEALCAALSWKRTGIEELLRKHGFKTSRE